MTATLARFGPLQAMLAASHARPALNQEDGYRDQLFGALDRLLGRGDAVLSLDIFDTLLLRDDSSELRRFWDIGGAMSEAVVDRSRMAGARCICRSRMPSGGGGGSIISPCRTRFSRATALWRRSQRRIS